MDKKYYWKYKTSLIIKFCVYLGVGVGYFISAIEILGLFRDIFTNHIGNIIVSSLVSIVISLGLTLGIQIAKSRVCSTILGVFYTIIAIVFCGFINEFIRAFNIPKYGYIVCFEVLLAFIAVCFDICAIGTYIFHSSYARDVLKDRNQYRQPMNNQINMGNQYGQPMNNQINIRNQYGQSMDNKSINEQKIENDKINNRIS